jgi:tRNA (adenine22-N1)-methyltransferase
MQISKRLEAVAGMVTSGSVLADIGTDHAYIPIYLTEAGRIPHAVAMDVNKGPLQKAREHIADCGLEQQIETRLSDGLAALAPGEAQSVLIAGMGGPLTVRILQDGRDKLAGCRELILQPQSDIKAVRAYIEREGWQIVREEMICEDGKYYPMMRAVRMTGMQKNKSEALPDFAGDSAGEPEHAKRDLENLTREPGVSQCGSAMTALELRFGPLLLAHRHPVLREYLLREQGLNERILLSLEGQTGEAALARASEVKEELQLICDALRLYE